MEKDSQKFLRDLIAYDPDLGAPPTEAIAEALEASMQDASLRAQHESECAFDRAFREKLGEIPVPADLASRICAEYDRRSNVNGAGIESSATPRSRGWWTHIALLGSMAAAIVILTLTYTFIVNPFGARETPELREMVVSLDASFTSLGAMVRPGDYEEISTHLTYSNAPVPKTIPKGINPEQSLGCRVMDINGVRVAMICFGRDDTSFHLFVISREAMPNLANILRPIIYEMENTHCATWTDEQNIYVLATPSSRQVLLSAL